MKKFILAVAAIAMFNISVYAEELQCDYKYIRAVKRVESFSTEMTEEAKNKWITELKKVHQLCEEGKEAEAKALLKDLHKDKEWDTVFSTHDTN
jgi:hypothetical protein